MMNRQRMAELIPPSDVDELHAASSSMEQFRFFIGDKVLGLFMRAYANGISVKLGEIQEAVSLALDEEPDVRTVRLYTDMAYVWTPEMRRKWSVIPWSIKVWCYRYAGDAARHGAILGRWKPGMTLADFKTSIANEKAAPPQKPSTQNMIVPSVQTPAGKNATVFALRAVHRAVRNIVATIGSGNEPELSGWYGSLAELERLLGKVLREIDNALNRG